MLNNLDEKCNKKIFIDTSKAAKFKKTVFAIINCQTDEEYNTLRATVNIMLTESGNFVDKREQQNFQNYYAVEWEKNVERWAGNATPWLHYHSKGREWP